MATWLYALRDGDPHRIQLTRSQRSRSCRDPHGILEELAAAHDVEVHRIGMELHRGTAGTSGAERWFPERCTTVRRG